MTATSGKDTLGITKDKDNSYVIHFSDLVNMEQDIMSDGTYLDEKETKAESQVHSALKSTYYEAYCDARKALKSTEKTDFMDENVVSQFHFDRKA